MPSRSCREQRDIHSACRWEREVPRSLRRQSSTDVFSRHGRELRTGRNCSDPFKQGLSESIYNPATPSIQQPPQPQAGNAIRGSARPAGSAQLCSSLCLFSLYSHTPHLSSPKAALQLSYYEDNLCVSVCYIWPHIVFFCSDFDDTAAAAIRLVGLSRRCIFPVPLFFLSLSKGTNLKGDMPLTSACPFVRQVGQPVLCDFLSQRLNYEPHLLLSGL